MARALQHECDHLDGMLYVDRISARARHRALKRMAELQEATRADWDERARLLGKALVADLSAARGLAAPAA